MSHPLQPLQRYYRRLESPEALSFVDGTPTDLGTQTPAILGSLLQDPHVTLRWSWLLRYIFRASPPFRLSSDFHGEPSEAPVLAAKGGCRGEGTCAHLGMPMVQGPAGRG